MSHLPPGWAEAPVSDLFGKGGLVTDGDWVESKDQDPSGEVRLIQLADVGEGRFVNRSSRFMNKATADRLRCTYLEPGDVLVARMPDPLGRACIFPGVGQPAVTAVDVLVWRAGNGGVDPRWLVSTVNAPPIRKVIESLAGGTTRQRIAGGRVKSLPLPVPPLAEQRRIVAKLDALTARTAKARAELDRIPALVASYKRAILGREITGGGGRLTTLADVIDQGLIGLVRSRAEQIDKGGVRYVRMQHFDLEGEWNEDDLTHVVASEAEQRRWGLRAGDLLFNTRNSVELVGKVALCPSELQGAVYNNNLLRIRFKADVLPAFGFRYMQSPMFRDHLQRLKSATTSVAAIYQTALLRAPIWVPPIDVQRGVVNRIEAAIRAMKALAAEAAAARRLLDRLDQAILAKTFRGELVPQDPNDEPASALLDRMRVDRAASPKTSKRGRKAVGVSEAAL